MNLVSSILRRFARTYLVAVGGGFTLVTLMAIVENGRRAIRYSDKDDFRFFLGLGLVLLISVLAVVAGFAINKFRWWALVLAGSIGILVIGSSISSFISAPLQPHTFTILVPMAAILVWASLPATRLEFKRQGGKTS